MSKESIQQARIEPWSSRSGVQGVKRSVRHTSKLEKDAQKSSKEAEWWFGCFGAEDQE